MSKRELGDGEPSPPPKVGGVYTGLRDGCEADPSGLCECGAEESHKLCVCWSCGKSWPNPEWHGAAQEVSPPSPEPCEHERLDADGTCKCGWSVVTRSWEAPYSPERELPRAEDSRKAQRKYAEGDTRELKAALELTKRVLLQHMNGEDYEMSLAGLYATLTEND